MMELSDKLVYTFRLVSIGGKAMGNSEKKELGYE